MKKSFIALLFVILSSCVSKENSDEFIASATGRYLFNSLETIEIYFEDKELRVKWRDMESITPLKVNDSTFYVEALNERMVFVSDPEMHIKLAPKKEHKGEVYQFNKVAPGFKTPLEFFEEKDYENALKAYMSLQQKDSLDPNIREYIINRQGYNLMRSNKLEEAIEMFKVNTHLYPNSSNTFDSLGEAYLQSKDTAQAIENFKKALSINPEKRGAKRMLKRLENK